MSLVLLLGLATAALAGPVGHAELPRRSFARGAQVAAPYPAITPPPELPSLDLARRDSIETVTVSNCYNYEDPTAYGDVPRSGCQCDGYDSVVPYSSATTLQTASNGSVATVTSSGCPAGASTFVVISSTVNPYPFTSTFSNSAVVAWATTAGLPDGAWMGAGDSTTIKDGKQLSLELNPSASQNVGTLTGSALYTSISSAISQGCGTIASGATMVTCTVPTITGVDYVEDLNHDLWNDGSLSLSIPFMSVTDNDVLQALISSVAGAFMASSTISNNSQVVNTDCGAFYSDSACNAVNITNIAALAQSIYTDDVTEGMHSPQSLGIALAFSEKTSSEYVCDVAALAGSSLYYTGILTAALAAIPGFEWVAGIGAIVEAVDAGSEAAIQGVALTCEIQSLTGTK
ncbi:hypothetical protein LTR36_001216 [Oleoguttula mirabilis]|uniref:Uncharacterized protein n=1 Tax=Oleoguttula mirabilis TaxID=1507867 RepID=A0AAV9JPR3_9PEZI|nr:hypothetical protein LTR36_001216 [Oleoguttula mirabilis]